MITSNLDVLMDRYVRRQNPAGITRNIEILLKAMRDNNINSFPNDKEELIFTTLCCDDLSMEKINEFVLSHGQTIELNEATFKELWAKMRSGGRS